MRLYVVLYRENKETHNIESELCSRMIPQRRETGNLFHLLMRHAALPIPPICLHVRHRRVVSSRSEIGI